MNEYLQTWQDEGARGTDAQMISALRKTLDHSYARLVATAAREWERRSGGPDPSDACVRVRISSQRAVTGSCPRRLGAGRS
jgi:hypothetical protein